MADASDSGSLRLKWSWVGLGGLILGISSLGALVIVATVKEADALATIALALAILAFVIQILVFIAQTSFGTQQNAQAQQVAAETTALLAELRANTQGTNTVLRDQFDKVLDRVLLAAKQTVSEEDRGSETVDDLRTRLLMDVREAVQEGRRSVAVGDGNPVERGTERRPQGRRTSISRWLSPMIIARFNLKEKMEKLEPAALSQLRRLGQDYEDSRTAEIPDGLYVKASSAAVGELLSKGLIATSSLDPDEDGDIFVTLTPAGRAGASLLLAPDPIPLRVQEALPNISQLRQSRDF